MNTEDKDAAERAVQAIRDFHFRESQRNVDTMEGLADIILEMCWKNDASCSGQLQGLKEAYNQEFESYCGNMRYVGRNLDNQINENWKWN